MIERVSKITIFTDGASKGNPGPGGWGAIIATESSVIEIGGREARTTNNRMELTAVFEALKEAHTMGADEIDIYADSAYVIGGATKWGSGWRKRGWTTATKDPVLNRDLWEPFLDLLDAISAKINWNNVGGHIGIPGNERVDEIATGYALDEKVALYQGNRSGYSVDVSHVRFDETLQQKKTASRARSNAKAYSYVSEVDGIVQVHKTWAECEARVRGKRARFKKALTAQEEREITQQFSR